MKRRTTQASDEQHHDEAETRPEDPAAEATASTPEVEADVDWKDRFMRARADFANLQRRSADEQRLALRYANADFARALLEVLDDFERTLQAAPAGAEDHLLNGIRLVQQKLAKSLQEQHVVRIPALGQTFDPRLHEALLLQPSREHEPNTVIQEVHPGYMLHDRVLRPARVIIAKAEPEGADSQTAGEGRDHTAASEA